MAITRERTGYHTGESFSFDIGTAGNDRLIVLFAGDESKDTNLTGATVDGKSMTRACIANNNNDATGNHQELWYITESDLGTSNGTVTIAISGGDAGWGMRVHLYYGLTNEAAPSTYGVDEDPVNTDTVSVANITNAADDLIVMSSCHGATNNWNGATSPLSVATSQGLGDPSSAVMQTYDAIETSANTNKTYEDDVSPNTFNRGTAIVAVWAAAAAGGQEYSQSISGGLGFSGELKKQISIGPDGSLTFSGALDQTLVLLQAVDGAISFGGSLAFQTGKALGGALSFAGSLARQMSFLRSLSGGLSFAGSLAKRTSIGTGGVLSFVGQMTPAVTLLKSLFGTLGFSGGVSTVLNPAAEENLRRRRYKNELAAFLDDEKSYF